MLYVLSERGYAESANIGSLTHIVNIYYFTV